MPCSGRPIPTGTQGKSGVSPKEHQDLARHSTYSMTARYTHTRAYDLAAAVKQLPIPTDSPDRETSELAATGTDGSQKNLGLFLGPKTACLRDKLRQTETIHSGQALRKNPGKQAVIAAFQGSCQDTSKVEAAGIEPASRGTSVPASTCVACHFRAAKTLRPRRSVRPIPPRQAGSESGYPAVRFNDRRLRCGRPRKTNLKRPRARFSDQAETSQAKLPDLGLPVIRQP